MTPEERNLLERTLKLSSENNEILKSIRRASRWTAIWGTIKFAVIVVPLIIGYLYLEPYLGTFAGTLKQAQDLLGSFK